ncbi:MAG: hypothetical protein LDL41_23915 [Coleofasciculus sp. S288]|nr:hypothetical protein [Coleofasciculus sp. S288]
MKRHLKIVINVLVSLLLMVLGTTQAAQAEEVWLDFSVPESDVVLAAPSPRTSTSQPSALNVKPSAGRVSQPPAPSIGAANSKDITPKPAKASENAAKLIALDFSVPNADPLPAPVAAGFSGTTELTPAVEAKEPPPPKPSLPPKTAAIKTPTSKPLDGKTRHQKVTALRRAIIGQESAGKFWIVNPDSGALGYGQLLRQNVAPWTKAALGRALTPEEFLANPDAQIKTIDHKLDEYLNRELAYTAGKNEELAIRRVASTWYSGNPNLWNNTRPQYSNGRRYPSIASYTHSVWKRYLREVG